MRNQWEKLSPKSKRIVLIGGAIGAAMVLMNVFSSDTPDEPKKAKRDDAIRQVLTDRDTRTVGLDSLSAKMKNMERKNRELERQLEVLALEKDGGEGSSKAVRDLNRKLDEIESEMKRIQEGEAVRAKELENQQAQIAEEKTAEEKQPRRNSRRDDGMTMPHRIVKNVDEVFAPRRYTAPADENGEAVEGEERAKGSTASSKGLTIHSHVAAADETEVAKDDAEDEIYLPVGSILTGVFITGMDAPTGNAARRDPFPATLRIQKEAILPNRFRADVRECFMMVSGYGDLSSERAYLRGEAISCVREDGGVIEATLDSYAVGEDGKAGVRGRLVSKEGQLVARSLMAGFLEGAAGAFNVQQAPSIRIQRGDDSSSDDKIPVYKQALDADTMQGAVAGGAGSALSRIAEYYIKMAESIFPVIEVDAGRQIDVVITRGTALKIRTKGKK